MLLLCVVVVAVDDESDFVVHEQMNGESVLLCNECSAAGK